MDKDLLRIVIGAIGLTFIIGMVLWSLFKNKKRGRTINFVDKGDPLDNIDESLMLNTENDDFDIVPIGSAVDTAFDPDLDPISVASDEGGYTEPEIEQQPETQQKHLPSIIQFSIGATTNKGFNGLVLADNFKRVGLEYGSMKIFERLDENRRVDYAVASMVEPGTFPETETELELFHSPGIVFFIQPSELDKPLEIFDDFIQTINWLANELGGTMLDHNRQPMTNETIQAFRAKLAD